MRCAIAGATHRNNHSCESGTESEMQVASTIKHTWTMGVHSTRVQGHMNRAGETPPTACREVG